ncbi:MAG: hypothetical protein JW827_07620 [Spirochaetes bacterium]|nr:hypothetical protein [Spirochaetota bacterium]
MKEKKVSLFNRILAYFLGLVSLTLPVFIYQFYVKWLGFPDGYLTEFERAEKILYNIFIWPCFGFGLLFIYLGRTASRQKTNKKLVISISLFFFYIIVVIIVRYYLGLHLDAGAGG